MASEQQRRENTTPEREVHIEKDTPLDSSKQSKDDKAREGNTVSDVGMGKAREAHEIGSHKFESLKDQVKEKEREKEREANADKARTANMVADKEAEVEFKRGSRQGGHQGGGQGQGEARQSVGKFEVSSGGEEKGRESSEFDKECRRTQVSEGSSTQITGKGDQQGRLGEEQQGSKGREGEMRSKEDGGRIQEEKRRSWETKSREEEGRGEENKQRQPSLEEVSRMRAIAQQNSMEAIRAAEERYAKAKELPSQGLGGTTEFAAEKGAQVKDTLLQGAQTAKETLASAGKTAVEKTKPVAEKAKEVAVSAGQTTLHYVEDRAVKAKDVTLEGGKKAKDMTLEGGKTAATYAGEVAVYLKDKATVAGWTAAHSTTEVAVEGTKAAGRVVKGAAEYAGHTAVDIVAKPLSMAKDAAVGVGEKAEEYTARKKEEAQKELEAKRSAEQNRPKSTTEQGYQGGEWQGFQRSEEEKSAEQPKTKGMTSEQSYQGGGNQGFERGQGGQTWSESVESMVRPVEKIVQPVEEIIWGRFGGGVGQQDRNINADKQAGGRGSSTGEEFRRRSKDSSQAMQGNEGQAGDHGVLGAIAETLVEIAQNTKDMVIGQGEGGAEGLSGGGEEWKSSTNEQSKQGERKTK